MRPLLSVVFVPSTPMNDDRLSTAGSFSTTSASFCWRSAIAENEIDCDASEIPWITPVSCTGKKPLGTTTYNTPVSTSVPMATSSVLFWRSSTHCSMRP